MNGSMTICWNRGTQKILTRAVTDELQTAGAAALLSETEMLC